MAEIPEANAADQTPGTVEGVVDDGNPASPDVVAMYADWQTTDRITAEPDTG